MPIVDVRGDLATPMQPIRIRPATSANIKRLKALLDASWLTHWAPHVLPASVERYMSERPAHGYVDAHWQRFMVAEREDGVLGMYDLEGEYLHAIHVHPDAIGSGVGRALMDHAEEGGAKRSTFASSIRTPSVFTFIAAGERRIKLTRLRWALQPSRF